MIDQNSTQQKRIMHVLPALAPAGAQRFVTDLLLHHDRQRYQVLCVCIKTRRGYPFEQILEEASVPVTYLGKRRIWDVKPFLRFNRVFREYQPDIVHTHLGTLTYSFFLMMKYRTPVRVHTIHNLADKEGRGVGVLLRKVAFRWGFGGVMPVAIAHEAAVTIKQRYGIANPLLIPNGIPTETFDLAPEVGHAWRRQEGFSENDVLILHLARFTKQKHQELLLDAFHRLQPTTQPWHLLLVGEGELEAAIRQEVQRHGLQDRAHFLGVRRDVPAILCASDLFVLSSRWEGNPISVMEALAAGRPVVSTAVGGIPELVDSGETGLLVPSGDPEALAEALKLLIVDRELRERMGARAKEVARERFDIRQTVRAYETLYEQLYARARQAKKGSEVVRE